MFSDMTTLLWGNEVDVMELIKPPHKGQPTSGEERGLDWGPKGWLRRGAGENPEFCSVLAMQVSEAFEPELLDLEWGLRKVRLGLAGLHSQEGYKLRKEREHANWEESNWWIKFEEKQKGMRWRTQREEWEYLSQKEAPRTWKRAETSGSLRWNTLCNLTSYFPISL